MEVGGPHACDNSSVLSLFSLSEKQLSCLLPGPLLMSDSEEDEELTALLRQRVVKVGGGGRGCVTNKGTLYIMHLLGGLYIHISTL